MDDHPSRPQSSTSIDRVNIIKRSLAVTLPDGSKDQISSLLQLHKSSDFPPISPSRVHIAAPQLQPTETISTLPQGSPPHIHLKHLPSAFLHHNSSLVPISNGDTLDQMGQAQAQALASAHAQAQHDAVALAQLQSMPLIPNGRQLVSSGQFNASILPIAPKDSMGFGIVRSSLAMPPKASSFSSDSPSTVGLRPNWHAELSMHPHQPYHQQPVTILAHLPTITGAPPPALYRSASLTICSSTSSSFSSSVPFIPSHSLKNAVSNQLPRRTSSFGSMATSFAKNHMNFQNPSNESLFGSTDLSKIDEAERAYVSDLFGPISVGDHAHESNPSELTISHHTDFRSVVVHPPLQIDCSNLYFDSNDPYRRIIESWDGSDETAELSNWIEVVRDNSSALKQASVQKTYSDLVDVARRLRDSSIGVSIKDRRWKGFLYRQSFVGSEALDWMMKSLREDWGLIDRKMAFHLAHSLLSCGFIRPCPPSDLSSAPTFNSSSVSSSSPIKQSDSNISASSGISKPSSSKSPAKPAATSGEKNSAGTDSTAFSNPFIMPFLHSHVVCFCPCAFCVRNRRGNKKSTSTASTNASNMKASDFQHIDSSSSSKPSCQLMRNSPTSASSPSSPYNTNTFASASSASSGSASDPPLESLCPSCPFTCSCCANRSCRNAFKRPHPPTGFVDGMFFYQFTDEPPSITLNPSISELVRPTLPQHGNPVDLLHRHPIFSKSSSLPFDPSQPIESFPIASTWDSSVESTLANPPEPQKIVFPPPQALKPQRSFFHHNQSANPSNGVRGLGKTVNFAQNLAVSLEPASKVEKDAEVTYGGVPIPSLPDTSTYRTVGSSLDSDASPYVTPSQPQQSKQTSSSINKKPPTICLVGVDTFEELDEDPEKLMASADSVRLSCNMLMAILKLYRVIQFQDPTVIPIECPLAYYEFKCLVARLRHVDLDRMNQESLLAFFLNVFNCLYMHMLIVSDLVHDRTNNLKTKRLALTRRVAYEIGPSKAHYTLMDIKYAVLRAQMPFPEMKQKDRFMLLPPFFGPSDSRSRNVIMRPEPRITFALCSGTESSPRLQIYQADTVYDQLESAVANYIRDHVELVHVAPMNHRQSSASSQGSNNSHSYLSSLKLQQESAQAPPLPDAPSSIEAQNSSTPPELAAGQPSNRTPSSNSSQTEKRKTNSAARSLLSSLDAADQTDSSNIKSSSPTMPSQSALKGSPSQLPENFLSFDFANATNELASIAGASTTQPIFVEEVISNRDRGDSKSNSTNKPSSSGVPSRPRPTKRNNRLASEEENLMEHEDMDGEDDADAEEDEELQSNSESNHPSGEGQSSDSPPTSTIDDNNIHEQVIPTSSIGADISPSQNSSSNGPANGDQLMSASKSASASNYSISASSDISKFTLSSSQKKSALSVSLASSFVGPNTTSASSLRPSSLPKITIPVSQAADPLKAQLELQKQLLLEEAAERNHSMLVTSDSSTLNQMKISDAFVDSLYQRAAAAVPTISQLSTSFEPPAHKSAADSNSRLIVRIPKLFDWYRNDFGKSSENLLLWIAQHHPDWMARCQISDYLSARSAVVEIARFSWSYDCTVFSPPVRGSFI